MPFMTVSLASRLAVFLCAVLWLFRAQAIVNGEEIPAGHPFERYGVVIGDGKGSSCGAVLVGPRTVLTAGHCPLQGAGAVGTAVTNYSTSLSRAEKNARAWVEPCKVAARVTAVDYAPERRIDKGLYKNGERIASITPDIAVLTLDAALCTEEHPAFDLSRIKMGRSLIVAGSARPARSGKKYSMNLTAIEQTYGAVNAVYGRYAKLKRTGPLPEREGVAAVADDGTQAACSGDSGSPVYSREGNGYLLSGVMVGAYASAMSFDGCLDGHVQKIVPIAAHALWIQQLMLDLE